MVSPRPFVPVVLRPRTPMVAAVLPRSFLVISPDAPSVLVGGERGRSLGERGIGSRKLIEKSRRVEVGGRTPLGDALSLVAPVPRVSALLAPRSVVVRSDSFPGTPERPGDPDTLRDDSAPVDCRPTVILDLASSAAIAGGFAAPIELRVNTDAFSARAACLARSFAISAAACDVIFFFMHLLVSRAL